MFEHIAQILYIESLVLFVLEKSGIICFLKKSVIHVKKLNNKKIWVYFKSCLFHRKRNHTPPRTGHFTHSAKWTVVSVGYIRLNYEWPLLFCRTSCTPWPCSVQAYIANKSVQVSCLRRPFRKAKQKCFSKLSFPYTLRCTAQHSISTAHKHCVVRVHCGKYNITAT